MKALHLPTLVGGHPWHLSMGERALGIDSQVLTRTRHQFGYDFDYCLEIDKKNLFGKVGAMARAFWRARQDFDVLHFNFGSSLFHIPARGLNQFDLPFYSKRQKLFVTYQGCDARQKFPTMARTKVASCHNPNCYNGQCNDGKLDEQRRQGIQKMARYVDHIWALNPDLLRFLPPEKSSFLPYAIAPSLERGVKKTQGKFRIVYAPTDAGVKGSEVIVPALKKLVLTYPNDVEVKILDRVARLEFLSAVANSDLLVDQAIMGWYGGAAVEAMMLGVAVAVRISEEDLSFIPPAMGTSLRNSVVRIEPHNIFEVLSEAVQNRDRVAQIAQSGEAYAEQWHSPASVARLVIEKYQA